MTARTFAELEFEYSRLQPLYARLCRELVRQLEELLASAAISTGFPIQQRVKTWESLRAKYEKGGLGLRPLTEIQDLAGVRVVTLFSPDASRVGDLIRSTFDVKRSYDTRDRLSADQFGYASNHFVVTLPSRWLGVPTFADLAGLLAEIQVRSMAQHIWAEASQALQYKEADGIPKSLQRVIHRASAILELVDIEFERLLIDRENYRAGIDARDLKALKDSILDVDVLELVLDQLLPKENKKSGDEDYSDLLDDLRAFEITQVDQLVQLIEVNHDAMLEEERLYLSEAKKDPDDEDYDRDRIARGVFFTHVGLTRAALEAQFKDEWKKYAMGAFYKDSENDSLDEDE